MAAPFLIVGLGNPGPKYAETRHNAGFWFLDAVLAKTGASLRNQARMGAETVRTVLEDQDCVLARPTRFMNECGQSVRAVVDFYQVPTQQVLVAYDELDLPPGTVRLKQGGGHGGHNGLRDLFAHLDDPGFLRLRIGIGHPGHKDAVTGYVLGRAPAQVQLILDAQIARAVQVIPLVLAGRFQEAQTALHTDGQSD
jgi:PTH1 family peptidyl-tRNA hydrolase